MTCERSLTSMLRRGAPIQLMACHGPLSARLAEEAGFDGVWASGFELSALNGLPDVSLVSMSQHLDMTRAVAGRVGVPVVADVDTGYGNAINVIHTVEQYERAGAAAIVMEDKTFPKVTSLVAGGRQELLRVEEFQGKIEAARDARTTPDFLIVARNEALIAGLGRDEALRRGHAYEEAGADLLLIHSKQPSPDEIVEFARAWKGAIPLVIVPTAYPQLDIAAIEALGNIRVVIYGNHAIRACVAAMRDAFRKIRQSGAAAVEDDIATVADIFRLQGMDRVRDNEKRYLR